MTFWGIVSRENTDFDEARCTEACKGLTATHMAGGTPHVVYEL
jgi:hypothetical protein